MHLGRRDFLKASAGAAMSAALLRPLATAETRNGMPYRALGKTGENVSLLGLGGAHIGGKNLTDDEAIRIMRTAVDEGVNFFDNAWEYYNGVSEERMGKALKDGYRDKVFVMTKVIGRTREIAQQELETSLRRLAVDVIDLWQIHSVFHPDDPKKVYEDGPLDVAKEALASGKIRYVGFTGHNTPATHLEMIERGYDWATVQMPLNIFDHHYRSFAQQVIPKAAEKKIGVLAMKTMGGAKDTIVGTGLVTADECHRYAMNLPISTVIIGMETIDELRANIALAKSFKPYTPEELNELLARTKELGSTGQHEPFKSKDA